MDTSIVLIQYHTKDSLEDNLYKTRLGPEPSYKDQTHCTLTYTSIIQCDPCLVW